jgi:hypothetical protein
MIETFTVVTLIFLYLIFFRPGKTPQLENSLVIERPGKYKITLAPKLNLAQPFIESIAARILLAEDVTRGSATQIFAVRDKQVITHACEGFLLVISYSDGMLNFQAEQPPSDDRTSHFEWLSEFAGDVLDKAPASDEHSTALDSCIIAATQNVACELGVDVNLLHIGEISRTIRQEPLTSQNRLFDFCG